MRCVNKYIPLPWVRMNIQKHLQPRPFFRYFFRKMLIHKAPNMLNFRQPHFRFRVIIRKKAPIHILPLCIAPIIARDDPVRIDHGQKPKLKVLAQFVRQDVPGKQEVHHAMNYEAWMGLSWVLPAHYHYCGLVGVLFLVLVRYLQQGEVDASITFTNTGEFNEWKRRCLRNIFNLPYMWLQLSISIWNSISYKDLIIIIVKFEIKTAWIKRLWLMWVQLVNFNMVWRDIVFHIEAAVEPALAVILVGF